MKQWFKRNYRWLFNGAGIIIVTTSLAFIAGLLRWLWLALSDFHPALRVIVIGATLVTAVAIASLLWKLMSFLAKKKQTALGGLSSGIEQPITGIPHPELVEDGLKYFTETILSNAAQYGASINTTAIFENYRDGDKILQFLESHQCSPPSGRTIEITRLILLDDPSKEYEWLHDFLSVRCGGSRASHGFSVLPRALHIQSRGRPLVRYLANSIPKISATTVVYSSPPQGTPKYLVFFGFWGGHHRDSFGLAFSTEDMFRRTERFLLAYQQRAKLYETPEAVPAVSRDRRSALLRRIKDRLLELAERRDDIVHVGLFGSCSMVAHQFLSEQQAMSHEADLDVVIVLDDGCVVDDPIRKVIVNAIRSERFDDDSDPEIEFSNLDEKYYECRSAVHIDIQLHIKGDTYYEKHAPILSFSIFGHGYTSIYSASREPIHSFLPHSDRIPAKDYRLKLALESSEYGLRTAIDRICDFRKYNRTDPRRVMWIQLCNTVWAITGVRPWTSDQAIAALVDELGDQSISNSLSADISSLLSFSETKVHLNMQLRKKCRKVLQELSQLLESSIAKREANGDAVG